MPQPSSPRRRPSASRPELVQTKVVQEKPVRTKLVETKPVQTKLAPKKLAPQSPLQRELSTKRRGELAELAFILKAANLGFGVARPFGDSERYDVILDARDLRPRPSNVKRNDVGQENEAHKNVGRTLLSAAVDSRSAATKNKKAKRPNDPETNAQKNPKENLKTNSKKNPKKTPRRQSVPLPEFSSAPDPSPPLWRIQVKCSTQLSTGLYRINAHRRANGRAVPYLPGEIHFFAAYIIPEDTWYLIPLRAARGVTSLLFRRRRDPKPGLYDAYREAWHLLRP